MIQVRLLSTLTLITILLTACGGGKSSSNDTTNTGGDTPSSGSNDGVKFFTYETGRIIYNTESHADFGAVVSDSTGTKTFLFKDWGATRVEKSNSTVTTVTNISGTSNTTVEQKTEFTKTVASDTYKVYKVDYKKEIIKVSDLTELFNIIKNNPTAVAESLFPISGDIQKTGSGNVAGYPCDVYTSSQLHTTNCIHERNIDLKSEVNNQGVLLVTETASSVEFNIDIPESEFTLPNYPHKNR